MDCRNSNMVIVLRVMLTLALSPLLLGCSGGCNQQKTNFGELIVDETLSPEQQLEMYKLQTNAFADSIFQEGYSILVRDVDSLFYVYYAKRDTICEAFYDDIVNRPPIMFKDIRTGRVQEVSIPTNIEGKQIKINTIIDYRGLKGKVIMCVTEKNPKELDEKIYESFDVLCFDAKDNSFHYIVGGCPWCVSNECVYDFKRDWIKIPFSEIFDGTFKNNPAILEIGQKSSEDIAPSSALDENTSNDYME